MSGPVGVGFGEDHSVKRIPIILPLFAAFTVEHLGVVVMGIMPVSEAPSGDFVKMLLAERELLRNVLVVVLAGVEQAGDGRRGDRRPASAFVLRAVEDSAVLAGALFFTRSSYICR